MTDDLPRLCREVQRLLPDLEPGGQLAASKGWSARVAKAHVKRCPDCSQQLAAQQEVAKGLAALKRRDTAPPPELLDRLLGRAQRPGWRGRVAVPARGAVSGAKPHLTVGLLAVGTLAGTGAGYAAWKGLRKLKK